MRDLVKTIPCHPAIQLLHFFNVLLCMKGWVMTDISVTSLETKHNMFQNDRFEEWCETGPAKGILNQHRQNRNNYEGRFSNLMQKCVQQTFFNEVNHGLDENVMNDLQNNRLVNIVKLSQPLQKSHNFLLKMIQDPNIANYPDVKSVLCRATIYSNYTIELPEKWPYKVGSTFDLNGTWEKINTDSLTN